jgi:hypothetical protein
MSRPMVVGTALALLFMVDGPFRSMRSTRPIHPYPVEACAEDVSVGLCGVERVRRGVEPAMRGGSGHSGVCLASMSTLKDRW